MRLSDYLKAAGVAVAVMALTMALSFPMVFVYATFIEPGHPQSFYNEAALWIAPWSSHLFGPLAFFGLNYLMARRRPERNALAFALACVGLYVVLDFSLVPLFGGSLADLLTLTVALSLAGKVAGAILGAWLGRRQAADSMATA
jgi:hypothetical protein